MAADGLWKATRVLPKLLAWAVVSAIFGVIISALRRKRGLGARMVSDIATLSWAIATYFVIPVLLYEDKGVVESIYRSASIVKRTWRESLAGNFGVGLFFFILAFPGLFLYPIGYSFGGLLWGIGLVFLYWILLGLIQAAVNSVLVSVLFIIAKTGYIPGEFDNYVEFKDAFSGVRYAERGESVPIESSARAMMFTRR
jgi:hypothetical protein